MTNYDMIINSSPDELTSVFPWEFISLDCVDWLMSNFDLFGFSRLFLLDDFMAFIDARVGITYDTNYDAVKSLDIYEMSKSRLFGCDRRADDDVYNCMAASHLGGCSECVRLWLEREYVEH